MLAIIETGGKQYKVEENTTIDVELLNTKDKKNISFDKVLLLNDGTATTLGTPYIENAFVKADIVENFRDDKIIVFKFKRKTGYKKTQGHRQDLLKVKIKEIGLKTSKEAEDKELSHGT